MQQAGDEAYGTLVYPNVVGVTISTGSISASTSISRGE